MTFTEEIKSLAPIALRHGGRSGQFLLHSLSYTSEGFEPSVMHPMNIPEFLFIALGRAAHGFKGTQHQGFWDRQPGRFEALALAAFAGDERLVGREGYLRLHCGASAAHGYWDEWSRGYAKNPELRALGGMAPCRNPGPMAEAMERSGEDLARGVLAFSENASADFLRGVACHSILGGFGAAPSDSCNEQGNSSLRMSVHFDNAQTRMVHQEALLAMGKLGFPARIEENIFAGLGATHAEARELGMSLGSSRELFELQATRLRALGALSLAADLGRDLPEPALRAKKPGL